MRIIGFILESKMFMHLVLMNTCRQQHMTDFDGTIVFKLAKHFFKTYVQKHNFGSTSYMHVYIIYNAGYI